MCDMLEFQTFQKVLFIFVCRWSLSSSTISIHRQVAGRHSWFLYCDVVCTCYDKTRREVHHDDSLKTAREAGSPVSLPSVSVWRGNISLELSS